MGDAKPPARSEPRRPSTAPASSSNAASPRKKSTIQAAQGVKHESKPEEKACHFPAATLLITDALLVGRRDFKKRVANEKDSVGSFFEFVPRCDANGKPVQVSSVVHSLLSVWLGRLIPALPALFGRPGVEFRSGSLQRYRTIGRVTKTRRRRYPAQLHYSQKQHNTECCRSVPW